MQRARERSYNEKLKARYEGRAHKRNCEPDTLLPALEASSRIIFFNGSRSSIFKLFGFGFRGLKCHILKTYYMGFPCLKLRLKFNIWILIPDPPTQFLADLRFCFFELDLVFLQNGLCLCNIFILHVTR
jgi:hypothetical protein